MNYVYNAKLVKSRILVPLEDLTNNAFDYRIFFNFLNKFAENNLKRQAISSSSKLPNCAKVGSFHFLMAFANLTEVQRDSFASQPQRLQELLKLFADYNNAVWIDDEETLANSLANYHRLVKGEQPRKPSFSVNDSFIDLLSNVYNALQENNIFKAHLLLQKKEYDNALTDLEMLSLNYLLARLSSYFQGRSYKYSEAANSSLIEGLTKEVFNLKDKLKNNPNEALCQIPGNMISSHAH
jgi:hypothetical protein